MTEITSWTDPESPRRQAVKVGDVLETYDCGYILVKEIRADGIIQGNVAAMFPPDLLWTWQQLDRYACLIVSKERLEADRRDWEERRRKAEEGES